MKTPSDPPPKGIYRTPGEREKPIVHPEQPTWVKGVVIAIAIALGTPAIMLIALFIFIIGVCGHWR